jgi:RNA polymerase sigma factor (sigma-70 family)
MKYRNNYPELGTYATQLIRSKAGQLVGKAGITRADCDDIEQELALDLWLRLKNFDPAKSSHRTFITRVVEHRVATLLKKRSAACRDWRLCRHSLDDPDWQGGEALKTRIEEHPDPKAKTRQAIEFELDLKAALETLPPDLRELWNLLLDSNLMRVAKTTRIPRTALYEQVKRLHDALHEVGF